MPLTPVYIAVLVFELSFDHWPVGHGECGLSVRQLQTYITYLAATISTIYIYFLLSNTFHRLLPINMVYFTIFSSL